jgi:signal transduction histidine kinase
MKNPTPTTASETGHILVVDDNRMNRVKLLRSLEIQGHTVDAAEDGRQALEMLRQAPYDVVLLDIMMPVMDGYVVLETMKADSELRRIPVIVISAVDELDSAVRCIEMGAEDYLPKNFNPVFLRARLASSLRRKKLRDLEQAYLQQEVMLRQSEKLATLGRLSAGMAHELNNPASAALSGSQQLGLAFKKFVQGSIAILNANLSPQQLGEVERLLELVQSSHSARPELDPLTRSDLEMVMEDWLAELGLDEAWEYAPAMVNLGLDDDTLQNLAASFNDSQLSLVIAWLVNALSIQELIRVIGEGTGRISSIVGALKTYTYLDQAPVQNVNLHDGLNNTLLMLNSRLKRGVVVRREYDESLPLIEAYGSELNQVWTNIIDNAISAMNGQGQIILRTYQDKGWAVVEIEDNGPGIPPDVQTKIFDPFFTTKPPGEGTGLGLNISYNIIVEKHHGEISVTSHPGATCFRIRLPLHREATETPD